MLMLASLGCLSLLTLRRRGKAANLLLRSRQAIPSEKAPMPESFSRHGRFAAGACSFHTPGGQGVLMRKRGGEAPFFTQRFLSKGACIPCVSITERRMATCAGPDESAANWTYAAATDGCGRRRCIFSLAAIGAMEGYATPSAAPRAGTRSPTPILPTPHMSGTWVPPAARTNPEGLPSPLCKERRPRRHGFPHDGFFPARKNAFLRLWTTASKAQPINRFCAIPANTLNPVQRHSSSRSYASRGTSSFTRTSRRPDG